MNCPGCPAHGVPVVYGWLIHPEMTKRWLQTPVGTGMLERHSPPTSGWRKVTKSTTPLSSPLLGMPSVPSLSNWAQMVSPPGLREIESSAAMSIDAMRLSGREGHDVNGVVDFVT